MATAAAALLAVILAAAASAVPLSPESQDQCGYASCPALDADVLNVHIVPHTHDDVGWLKTVDQYYYGSRNTIQKAGVQYILDSVIRELWEDPKRRFIYVETAFFWKWWQRQHDSIRHKVHALVRQGRLEFIGGAWSMNDEADVHYQSTIDQFTWGLRKLNETFGECGRPRVGWQIDPFGHSRELASLLAGMGYDGLFHGRIDYQDKLKRLQNKNMEMVWRGNDDLGAQSDLFTGVLFNTYSPPPGFCFDVLCQDEPIIDDPDSPMYNVDKRVNSFLVVAYIMSEAYRTKNILVTMGDDFNYQDARMWFLNLDLLIKYTNLKAAKDKLKVKLFYSTPSCYLKAVHDAKPLLPTKQDDFFPYASDPHAYWTGYFTSRPTSKYFERRGNAYLQMAKQLQVLAQLEEHNRFVIDELRGAMGVMQHHDAVTGTEKQHVADDYARMLDSAIEDSLIVARQAFSKLTESDPRKLSEFSFERCQLNISQCAASEDSRQFVVTAYNPLGWSVTQAIRVPVTTPHLTVRGPQGEVVESQVVELPGALLAAPPRHSSAIQELVFEARALPPLGYRSYYVQPSAAVARSKRQVSKSTKRASEAFPLDIPAEYYRQGPVSARDQQEEAALRQIAAYIEAKNRIDTQSGRKHEGASTQSTGVYDEYNVVESVEEENGAKSDSFNTRTDNARYDSNPDYQKTLNAHLDSNTDYKTTLNAQFDSNPDYQKTLNAHLNSNPNAQETLNLDSNTDYQKIVNENEKYLEYFRNTYTDKNTDRQQARERDLPFKFVKMSSMNEERMLGDDPMTVQVYSDDDYIENEHIRVSIDRATGEFTSLALPDGTDISFDIDLLYYPGWLGNNQVAVNRASGAYIFRPNATRPTSLSVKNGTRIVKGPVVQEIHHEYSEYASSVTRLYKNSQVLEFEWLVGPIPIQDNVGKEVIVRYHTNLSNSNVFYTDSNGRQSLKRILNKRPQWDVRLDEPIAGNYYPVTSKIFIEDLNQKLRLAVMNDRAQGGTSLNEGQIELMLHRRLLHDDAFGVGEALNETAEGYGLIARGKHYISLGKIDSKSKQFEKKQALEVHLQPEIFVSNASMISFDSWRGLKNEWSGLRSRLPEGVHLLTVEPWKAGSVLVRLEHIFEKTDLPGDTDGSVSVDLANLFANLTITSLKEASLGANQWWKDRSRFTWDKENSFSMSFNEMYGTDDSDLAGAEEAEREETSGFVVSLKPMEIKTFVVEFNKS